MNDLTFAPMNESHLDDVLAIEHELFDTPWTREMFYQEILGLFGSDAVVALAGGRVVGYQIAWFIEDEVHLVNIAVDKRHQGRGIGRELLSRLIEEALEREQAIITLEVRAGNKAAQDFYRRFLFRTVGIRKGYYSDNREDALLMVLDLATCSQRRHVSEGKPGG